MRNLTELEDRVLDILLRGENETLTILREQSKRIQVSSREMTGVGFYTEFEVTPDAPRILGRPAFKLGDVNGTAGNVRNGIGFLLYVKDGVLSMLEGYTYDEPWPSEVQGLKLTYSTGADRDIDKLRQSMTSRQE